MPDILKGTWKGTRSDGFTGTWEFGDSNTYTEDWHTSTDDEAEGGKATVKFGGNANVLSDVYDENAKTYMIIWDSDDKAINPEGEEQTWVLSAIEKRTFMLSYARSDATTFTMSFTKE